MCNACTVINVQWWLFGIQVNISLRPLISYQTLYVHLRTFWTSISFYHVTFIKYMKFPNVSHTEILSLQAFVSCTPNSADSFKKIQRINIHRCECWVQNSIILCSDHSSMFWPGFLSEVSSIRQIVLGWTFGNMGEIFTPDSVKL
mgnify:CR=1 FL=1